ncbi:MAG: DUF4249 family protein [Melioribacteraceae bacterium]|nr:DUF4249 family protein [Melioribacteraceae bacterium]
MKNIFLLINIFLIFLSISCDDNVNPKANFKEEYVLNCVLKADTNYQIATISKSYDVDGYDPNSNKIDPFIKGATIKVYYRDSIFTFKDTSTQRSADSKYNTPINFYYIKKLKPSSYSQLKIEALLPNGKILTASTESFFLNTLYFSKTVDTYPPINANKIIFSWDKISGDKFESTIYFAPELAIVYSKFENGNWNKYYKKVPIRYLENSPDKPPIYPEISVGKNSVSFDTLAFGVALREISKDITQRKNYKIENALFRLLILDKNLAAYYSLQKTFLDEFSVRINQPDFTNIKGGLGIFGIYAIKQINIPIESSYILKFGYSL